MKQQTFANHSRMVFGFHGILFLAIISLLIGSIMNLVDSSNENLYSASLLVLASLILLLLMFYARAFALKAQDRAIRVEEKLRYFMLTGKAINNKITTRQFVGLRFASDDEFAALAEKAAMENLSENDIKKEISNWKADEYRV